jgi:hypothetical protein
MSDLPLRSFPNNTKRAGSRAENSSRNQIVVHSELAQDIMRGQKLLEAIS